MADTTALKNRIRAAIKANDNQEITGPVLQQTLLDIVDELDLYPELENETQQRRNGDNTLQQNITVEKNRAEGAESILQQNIVGEATARQQGDTELNNLIISIKNNIDNGYVYAGIATPTTTPVSGKVFYMAMQAGTYINFGGQILTQGINILSYNGTAWSSQQFIGINDELIGDDNLVKGKGVERYAVKKSIGSNLLDPEKSTKSVYINSSGNEVTSDLYDASDYIPVIPGESYACSIEQVALRYVNFYDVNKNNISSERIQNATVFTIPNDAYYIRVSYAKTKAEYAEVAKGTVRPSYEPYSPIANYHALPMPKSVTDNELNSNELKVLNKKTDGLGVVEGSNLFNEQTMVVVGKYITNSGNIANNASWAKTDYIPVIGGENYYITAETIGRATGLLWFDAEKNKIEGIDGGTAIIFNKVHTAPLNAAFLAFNLASNNVYSTKVMLAQSSIPVYYESQYVIPESSVKGLTEISKNVDYLWNVMDKRLNFNIDGTKYTVQSGVGAIVMKKSGANYAQNPMLNFVSCTFGSFSVTNGDDVAPARMLNMTIGANHGLPCAKAVMNAHGFDNTIIGTEWSHSNGKKYYPALIVDADNILFISQNDGTHVSPVFSVMPTGTLTYNGNSYIISTVVNQQLYPSVGSHVVELVCDNRIVSANGNYACDEVQLIESYDIINPASVLENLIARAGQSSEPSFDGEHVATVQNVYKFDRNLNVVVVANFVVNYRCSFRNVMFSQAARIGNNGEVKYYIPNSLPWGTVDLRVPSLVEWSSSLPSINTDIAHTQDTDFPINRVLQYLGNIGFALGYVPNIGVSNNLFEYTSETFEVRNNTGKVYPHGVNSVKQGDVLEPGTMFSAAMYRCFFDANTEGNRISAYHFRLNNHEYVYADYRGSMVDNINISMPELNGKEIHVIESNNVILKTSVFNNGFYVESSYINGETSYIILSI